MQVSGTPQESDNTSIFWERQDEYERKSFVFRIVLGKRAYALEKASNNFLFV